MTTIALEARLDPKYSRVMRWDEIFCRLPAGPCTMAEIGVWTGGTAVRLLGAHPRLFTHLVDPWQQAAPGTSYANSGSMNATRDHERPFVRCMKRLRPFGDRFKVHRMTSKAAAPAVEDASLDLVFVDADHSYEGVAGDIDTWLSKVKSGGWIGGHDFGDKPNGHDFPGVERAVRERFAADAIELGGDYTWWHRVD